MKDFLKKHWGKDKYDGIAILKRNFWDINFFKTIYFNFKAFEFKDAILLPVLVGHRVKIYHIGNVSLTCKAYTGMVSIGVLGFHVMEDGTTKLRNDGHLYLGAKIKIHQGAKLSISESGNLTLEGRNTIGSSTRIVCRKSILIGYNSGCSWDCQIFDTDFHYLYDCVAERPLKRLGKIQIGNNVFIGNHCNIGKGSKIPNGCVISSWSNVSGNFTKKGENLLISNPRATVIGENYTMTHAWDSDKEKAYRIMLNE